MPVDISLFLAMAYCEKLYTALILPALFAEPFWFLTKKCQPDFDFWTKNRFLCSILILRYYPSSAFELFLF